MARTEEEWEEAFGGAVEGPAGAVRSQSPADRAAVMAEDPKKVWSVVEGEDDSLFLLPAFHVVNVVGHVVAGRPRTGAEEASGDWNEVLWVDGSGIVRTP